MPAAPSASQVDSNSEGHAPSSAIELALVFTLYCFVTALLFRAALPYLSTHYLGDGGDTFQFVWNAWWMDHSLLHGRNPWFCDTQMLPTGTSLALHTLSELPMTVVALLTHVFSQPLAYNLVLLACFPLAGVCMFALAKDVTRQAIASFPAGLAFMLCPFFASRYLGHFNLMYAGFLPLLALWHLRAMAVEQPRASVRVAALYLCVLLCNIHTAILASNLVVWSWVWESMRSRDSVRQTRRYATAYWPTLGIIGAYGVVIAATSWIYGLRADRYGSPMFCPDLLSFALPMHFTSWWSAVVGPLSSKAEALAITEVSVYLGWLVLAIAIGGWWVGRRDPRVRWALMLFVVAFVLALGPYAQWNREPVTVGPVKLYLPMAIYRHVPLLGIIGQSGRYMILGYMAMAIGVACALAAIMKRQRSLARCATVLSASALIVADYGFKPVWVPPPEVVIPPGPGRVFDPRIGNSHALYGQIVHGRGLVGGYVARYPRPIRLLYEENPGLGWFFRKPERRAAPPTREEFVAAVRAWDIAYVSVGVGSPESECLRSFGFAPVASTARDDVFDVSAARSERRD